MVLEEGERHVYEYTGCHMQSQAYRCVGEGEGKRDGCHKQSHARIQGVDRVGKYGHGCWWPRGEHYGEEEVDAYSDLRNRSCVRGRVGERVDDHDVRGLSWVALGIDDLTCFVGIAIGLSTGGVGDFEAVIVRV